MRFIIQLIGSIHFSLALFCFSALVVAYATLSDLSLERQNHFYSILMVGFFLNLLFSLCRRFPFRFSHLSFILAHCGLMLVFGYALINGWKGWEGIWVVTKKDWQSELIMENSSASLLLHPFKKACDKAGYSYVEVFEQWLSQWKNREHGVFSEMDPLTAVLENVMHHLDWNALPPMLQSNAISLSQFLQKSSSSDLSLNLVREIVRHAGTSYKNLDELSSAKKAHLYSCCLFLEGLQNRARFLHLKQIPYAAIIHKANEKKKACSLLLMQENGNLKKVKIALNRPLDLPNGYRVTLQQIAENEGHVHLFVRWNPLSTIWLVIGSVLTGVGVLVLGIQKVKVWNKVDC